MNRATILLAQVALLAGLSFQQLGRAQEPVGRNAHSSPLDDIIEAKSPGSAQRLYASVFDGASPRQLDEWQGHDHLGVALHAAWTPIRLSIPVGEQERPVRPDRAMLRWFAEFAEGHMNVTLPKWWKEALLDAQAHRRDNIFFLIPASGLGLAGGFNVSIDERRSCVATPCDRPAPFEIKCVNVQTRKRLWKGDVWAGGMTHYTGDGYHLVEAVCKDGALYVFGVGDNILYVEGFESLSGKNLFRFSTSY
jgi:hypothetical protein